MAQERTSAGEADEERNSIIVNVETADFHSGFTEALANPPRDVWGEATEAGIVEIVRNLTEIAVEGWLSEKQLRHDVGLIVGWLYRPNVKVGMPEQRPLP